jgi:hypothetical protein
MLDNLLGLVKQYAGDAIINNPAIPNERNDEAIETASSSIFNGLQQTISNGGLKDVLGMFSGGDAAASPVAQQINGGLVQNLMQKFGLDQGAASGVAGNLIPAVLQNFVAKTNDPNDNSFDLQSIMNNLSGGAAGNINVAGLMDKFKNGAFDKDGDGDTDLQDAMNLFNGGGTTGGGLMDTVKGLFGK